MKILATADLHNRHDWYDWLLQKAPQYDAVVIAGDLLDMFQDLPSQINLLRQWVTEMKSTGTPLIICDGNHDFNSVPVPIPVPPPDSPSGWADFVGRVHASEHWMDALVEEGTSVVSGRIKGFPELDNLIVTSLFYGREYEEANASLLEQGAQLRRASRGSLWMVLHHEPPVGLIGSPEQGNQLFGEWIEEFQPQVTFSGHDHDSPTHNGTCCERIGLTYAFNPGHNPDGKMPCHIVLETKTMKYTWHQ